MRIQLISCQVINFRSIRDTGFFNFSADNITAIIGQNESGKTSILEALESFATGKIDPEILRSEDELPEITCIFSITNTWIDKSLDGYAIPRGFKAKIKQAGNKISFTRKWSNPTISEISLNKIDLGELFPPTASPTPITPASEATQPTEGETTATTTEPQPAPSPEPEETLTPLTQQEFVDRLVDSLPEFQKFEDFESLLPDTIDLDDITKNDPVEGLRGVTNLLNIMGLDVSKLETMSERFRNDKMTDKNRTFTAEFKQFWSQKIGNRDKVEIRVDFERHGPDKKAKAGLPYLSFWIIENQKQLRPKQRSKGLRWFLSFYLQLKASAVRSDDKKDLILLIDEPAGSLHAKAQEDVLAVFETLKKNIQVIYTTHTHYLLDLSKIYRIIAAQRETLDDDEFSLADTHIFNAHQLGATSPDTLTPLFDCMGTSFANQNVIARTNNILVEEISSSYYLKAILKLKNMPDIHLLPASGTSNVPVIARLLTGWGIRFGTLVDDEPSGKRTIRELKKELFPGSDTDVHVKALFSVVPDCAGIEDLLSKENFATLVAEVDPQIIQTTNSAYVGKPENRLSKGLLAVKFMNKVSSGEIDLSKLDNTSKRKIDTLCDVVTLMMAELVPPTQVIAPQVAEQPASPRIEVA